MAEFRVLGRVEVLVDGRPVDLGEPRRRCVLVALLVDANREVPAEQLITRVWGHCPPPQARNALSGYVSRLRRALADVPGTRISLGSRGYVCELDEQVVDLNRFRRLLGEARAAGDADASGRYQQALGLWRGEAFAGLHGDWLDVLRSSLEEERLAAELDYHDVRLRLGRHTELLPALAALVEQRPLDERVAAQSMLALYRGGRQADALDCYQRVRLRLADELGTDPGPPLRRLHEQILLGDPALAPQPAKVAARNDLPRAVADFTGRADEIGRLLDVARAEAGARVVVAAIDGMAGVGKTTLVLQTAHRLAGEYPGGQLFVGLHGHTEGRQPTQPATALAVLLRAVGVRLEEIPDLAEQRASRWRAELARRRVLVVLDNASCTTQVQPLLPGTGSSLALVTSRRRLAELDAACSLSLDVLPPEDAITLLTRIAGESRVAVEPDATAEVARLCGYLPLALRIAGARLRARPAWSMGHLAGRLAAEQGRLAELAAGDRSVAAAFTLSYRHLAPALTGSDLADAERGLEQLLDAHLLGQPVPGRYQLHDLLREHAKVVVRDEEPAPCLLAAVDRVFGHYRVVGAHAVASALPMPGVTVPTGTAPAFAIPDQGLDWLRTERPNLHAALQVLSDTPDDLPARLDLLALLSCGDPTRSAILALADAGLRLEEGRARLRAGLSLAAAGRPERARAELTARAVLFRRCGARDLQAQAALALDGQTHHRG